MASTIFGSDSAAVRAVLHVNVEYAFEQANPADAAWLPLGGLSLIFDSRRLCWMLKSSAENKSLRPLAYAHLKEDKKVIK